ncbi:efflux RND transporter periplasmic adaptor subunit, partial [Patescibacteria group bacterium]|nr:efflux RND transporter periplasmic adaptor subunit [Patescibacteria group bacterium]
AYYSLVSAQAAVSKGWLSYQATIDGTIKATAKGVVANLSIAGGQQVNLVDPALLIVADGGTWITISVTENDVVELRPGQVADVSVDALPDEKLTGEVKRVDSVGVIDSGVVTYNVYIQIDQDETKVLPSMTVGVDIVTNKKDDALVIPNSAIKPYQGSKAVQILEEKTGQLIYLPIKVGISGATKSEVLTGLTEGQQIIASTNGDSVQQNQGSGMNPFGH